MSETAYLAAEGYVEELIAELGDATEIHGRLVLAPGPARAVAWAANIWRAPERIAVASIGEAAKALRARQRNWACYASELHRRAALIQAKLPKVSAKPLVFPSAPPQAPLGSWTLLDAGTLLAAQDCSSPFPNGEVAFVEDRAGPPNRAYLKLWEAFTRLGVWPAPGAACLDLGASPGGWSWVLARLGARVIAVDKAPLAPRVTKLPGVTFQAGSAFALDPKSMGKVDWLVSDVVCYPDRLLRLLEAWIGSGHAGGIVATVKFQGETDLAAMEKFKALPGGALVHLHHNKHELTWMRPPPAGRGII
ncbi:MAG: hypothetical protein FJX47_07085 [Alphaproteobacteria bacterium]|nr:hypothetical protein [Alphaproteobacteria bacterium]